MIKILLVSLNMRVNEGRKEVSNGEEEEGRHQTAKRAERHTHKGRQSKRLTGRG